MSTKIKTLISVLIVALLLTVGATATVMADEAEDTPPETGRIALLERVADILEIDQDDLIDAFKQARQEMMGDTFGGWWGQEPGAMERGMFKHNRHSRIWPGFGFHLQDGSGAGFCPGLPGEAD